MNPLAELTETHLPLSGINNGKILIVGGRSTNFSDFLRSHTRLIFWDSTDPQTFAKTRIPEGVTLILMTSFVSHSLFDRLKSFTPKGIRLLSHPQGTGRIKAILEAAGIKEVQTVTRRPQDKRAKGWLAKFISKHADFDAEDVGQQIRSLYAKASIEGVETTESSIGQCFYRLRRQYRMDSSNRPRPVVEVRLAAAVPSTSVESAQVVDVAPLTPTTPASAPEIVLVRPIDSATRVTESAGHLREFVASLHDFGIKAELAAVALEEVLADRERLLRLGEELDRIKETLKSFLTKNGSGPH